MSVAQFTPVLRQRIIELYSDKNNKVDLANFGRLTRAELFKKAPDTKDIRKRFEAKDFHTSSLTLEGMSALTKRLVDSISEEKTKDIIEQFFNSPDFFTNFVSFVEGKATLAEYGSGDYRLEQVPQETLKNYFIEFLKKNLSVNTTVIDNIAKNIQSGHLAGVFFLKLKVALGIKAEFSTDVEATYRDFTVSIPGLEDAAAVKALDSVLKAVLDADFLTSNLITESQVFIDATKKVLGDSPSLVTELQFTADNKAAGDLLQQTGKQLNLLINAARSSEMGSAEIAIKKLIATLQPVVDTILLKAEELKAPLQQQGIYDQIVKNAKYLAEELINTPGSVTLKDGIGKNIANVIKTGSSLAAQTTPIKPRPIKQKHKEVLDISQAVKEFKKAAETIKKTLKELQVPKNTGVKGVKRARRAGRASLTSLQNLLNSLLVDRVKQNMGSGNRRDILNLRTGRLAESVKVERLTESREGMITAFYSYMKNPYATFSQGGRQEVPRSRDPKLLISKSIRELLQKQVANKLRAVSV